MRKPRALLLLLLSLTLPAGTRAWDVRLDGAGNGGDEAEALALAADGSVIAAGKLVDPTRLSDFAVARLDGASGTAAWVRSSYGNGGSGCCGVDEGAHAVTVDAQGIVFAAGHLEFDPPPTGRTQDFAVIRYQPGGELWRGLLDGGRGGYFGATADLALDVALDPQGNPVAAGRLTVLSSGIQPTEFTVAKFAAANGALLWARRLLGTQLIDGPTNSAQALALDPSGDVFAAGWLTNAPGREFVVLKLAGATGGELWRRELGAGAAFDVAVDKSGNAIAVGQRAGAYAIKLDGATGATLWERELPDGMAARVALDAQGNAAVVGEAASQGGMLAMLLAASSGSELWPRRIIAGSAGQGSARDVAITPSGALAVAGYLWNTTTHYDFTVLELASATGLTLWSREIDGGLASQDEARAIAVDPEGHVVAAGRLDDPVGRIRFTVLKLRGRDGADLAPCGDVDDDRDVDVADLAALRAHLAGASPGIAAPQKCSVYGGARDCDLVDAVVFLRWLASQKPRIASVCAAVVE